MEPGLWAPWRVLWPDSGQTATWWVGPSLLPSGALTQLPGLAQGGVHPRKGPQGRQLWITSNRALERSPATPQMWPPGFQGLRGTSWGHLLLTFPCRTGWPGVSHAVHLPPIFSQWAPRAPALPRPTPGEVGPPPHSGTWRNTGSYWSPAGAASVEAGRRPHRPHRDRSPLPAMGWRSGLRGPHKGLLFQESVGASEGSQWGLSRRQRASGPAECPRTRGHLPRAFKVARFGKTDLKQFSPLSTWFTALFCRHSVQLHSL